MVNHNENKDENKKKLVNGLQTSVRVMCKEMFSGRIDEDQQSELG